MKTPAEKKEIERLRKQAYRARIKEQNPEEFLQKQKQEKANQRAKRKEIIPIEVKEPPKKSVKIKVKIDEIYFCILKNWSLYL